MSVALSRILVTAVVFVALAVSPIATPCGANCHLSTNPLLDAASRWDGGWYLSIARDGYGHPEGTQSDLAFFPLYPAFMRVLGTIGGSTDDSLLLAGVVISTAALAVASVLMARAVALDHGPKVAASSVALMLAFPTTVFFSAVYAESLYLACAIGSLYLAQTGRATAAGIAGALAALARPFGVLLVIPLAVELRAERRSLLALALPVAAFAGWMTVMWRMTGDPLAFLTAQAGYGRRPGIPFAAFAELFDRAAYGDPYFILVFGGLVVVLVVASWRVLRRSHAAYATVFLLAAVSSGTLTSMLRYSLAIFPIFIALAALRPSWPRRIYLVTAGTTAVLFTAMFALWYWIG
jgi:hypothetical protein